MPCCSARQMARSYCALNSDIENLWNKKYFLSKVSGPDAPTARVWSDGQRHSDIDIL